MVVLTQSQQEAIWEHLLTAVLQQPKDNDYWMVLKTAGITNVTDFIADQDDIDDVKKWYYDKPIVDADGNPVKDNAGQPTYSQYTMKRYEANMTFIAKDYVWKTAINLGYSSTSDMKHTDYMKLDKEGYDRMRTDPNYKMRRDRITSGSNANPANPGNPNPQTTNKSAVDQFQKSIKRDQSAFPTLKNDDHFDTWNRGTIIQAKIQDVADVLSANYTPITAEDKALFQLKQQFMYGVFERTLTTDKGKSIVRKYQDDVDAQKVYQDTKKHYTDSVKARFDSSKYLRYITTAKYDQSWTGTSQAFIIHWQEQARLYNSLVPASQKYKNNALLVLLQTAVNQCPELRSVYNMAQQLEASSGNVLDYDKYVTTLLSACVQLDSTLGPKKPIKTQRGIYHAQYDHHDNVSSDTLEPDLPPLGIDTPISDIEAYFVRRRGPNSSMTKNQWDRLSSDGQTIWDTMTNEDKAIILEPRPAIKPQPQLTGPPNLAHKLQDSNYQRNLNLSNISAAEYLQMMHEHSGDSTRQSQDPTPAFTPPTNDGTDSTSLLTFLSDRLSQDKNDKPHPAHLQRMMSSSQASKTSKETGKPEVKSISWMGRTYTANSVDVTSKTQYSVRKVSRLKDRALVDRGANGGVAGDDVYVISRDPIRKVDITGVENHQVKDIYIGSVAGMVQSTKGPVIAVMHQQALLCKGSSILSSIQMEAAGCDVNDKSLKLKGGQQRIVRHGHVLPLTIQNGLPRLKMRPCTRDEFEDVNIPHVVLTDDHDWDPTILDNDDGDDIEWFDAQQDAYREHNDPLFDQFGNYKKCTIINHADVTDTFLDTSKELENFIIPVGDLVIEVFARETEDAAIDFDALRPNFAWQPADIVKKTFDCTTQYGRLSMGDKFQTHYRSPHPALNVRRRDEDVATDTVYSDTPAIDDGATIAQFFCGTESLVCDIY